MSVSRPALLGSGRADAMARESVPRRVRLSLHRRSLRTRIGVLVAVAVGFAVALAALAAYLTVRHELRQRLDTALHQRAQAAVDAHVPYLLDRLAGPSSGDQQGQLAAAILALGADVRPAVLQTNRSSGTPSISSVPTQVPPYGAPEIAVAAGQAAGSLRTAGSRGVSYRVIALPIGPGEAFILAQATTDTDRELARMALVMGIVGLGGIVVAASAGLGVARQGLRPVERLTAATEHIARTDDLTPIRVNGGDELARLTLSFNAMLQALNQSRERQRQLIADAGHELRTPLTSLRTNFDLLAQAARPDARRLDPRDHDELLADVRAQLAEMAALVGDLVELARTDSPAASVEQLDLADVVQHAVDRVRRRAPAISFDITLASWTVVGDRAALERAATNLLDNAAKWSPAGGTIRVRLADGALTIADNGPGIADEDLPHVFDRFYRAVDARSQPGSGLGLAIVAQAAHRHGGQVTAGRAGTGGALFTFWLPGGAPQAAASEDRP
ncbi:MAG: HAMP domain-containing sensor histidine kinase [Mycobacteriales bacterium]